MNKKTIRVVAAVIKSFDINKNKTLIFSTQKGKGEFENGWEFPGGKIEQNETPKEALKREIKEELNVFINIGELIDTIEYDYPKFHLSMDCFWCEIINIKDLKLNEHKNAKWLMKEEIDKIKWLPADLIIIDKIKEKMI